MLLVKLQQMAENYVERKPAEFTGKVNIIIDQEGYALTLEQENAVITEGCFEERLLDIITDTDTFSKLADGSWTGITAAGREHISDSSPLDFRLPYGKTGTPEVLKLAYHIGMHFFNATSPVTYYGPSYARPIQGGKAVPLVYGHGLRYTYYTLSPGETLTAPKEQLFLERTFTVINGAGTANLNNKKDKSISLSKGVVLHMPLHDNYLIEAGKEGLELFMLAYNI